MPKSIRELVYIRVSDIGSPRFRLRTQANLSVTSSDVGADERTSNRTSFHQQIAFLSSNIEPRQFSRDDSCQRETSHIMDLNSIPRPRLMWAVVWHERRLYLQYRG